MLIPTASRKQPEFIVVDQCDIILQFVAIAISVQVRRCVKITREMKLSLTYFSFCFGLQEHDDTHKRHSTLCMQARRHAPLRVCSQCESDSKAFYQAHSPLHTRAPRLGQRFARASQRGRRRSPQTHGARHGGLSDRCVHASTAAEGTCPQCWGCC